MYPCYQGSKATREFFRVHVPVTEPGPVVVTLAKPAIINDKKFDSQLSSTLRQLELLLFSYVKVYCLPTVVQHLAQLFSVGAWQHIVELVQMQMAAGLTKA